MTRREEILAFLDEQGVAYKLVEHPRADTMEDIVAFGIPAHGEVAKNLFLRDSQKGRRHMLVTVRGDAPVDLQKLGAALGERLSFASEQRLERLLNLKKGEVTPLGAYYDREGKVEIFIDRALVEAGTFGIHPCDNTATVFIAYEDLKKALAACGHTVQVIDVK